MAISTPALQEKHFSNTTGPWTTGSFTPPANSLLVAFGFVMVDESVSSPGVDAQADMQITDSAGLTWTKVVGHTQPNSWASGLVAWVAQVGGSPASMTVTMSENGSWTAYSGCLQVLAVTAHDTADSVGHSEGFHRSDTGDGAWNLTMASAPALASMVIAALATDHDDAGGNDATPGAGWTEIHDESAPSGNCLQTQYRTGSTSTGLAWADTATASPNYTNGAVVVEILEAPAGGGLSIAVAMHYYKRKRS